MPAGWSLGHIIAGNCGFSLSDASEVSGSIEMDDGSFNLSDASSLALQGSADDIDIQASSSSDLKLSDFAVVTAAVDLSQLQPMPSSMSAAAWTLS